MIIEQRDALDVIRTQDCQDTLFMVDPPYLPSTRDAGTHYRHELDDAAHVALLDRLNACSGAVMLCGYPSALYDAMLSGWTRIERPHFAAAVGAQPRTEVLWMRPARE